VVGEEVKAEAAQEGAVAAAEVALGVDDNAEAQDFPVTMAVATAESAAAVSVDGSQWTAVPVALEGEDATVSLELEMQKAYAAYAPYVAAAAESASVATAQEVETPTAENLSLPEIAPVVEAAPVENFSAPEPDAAPAPVAEPESSAVEALVAEPAAVVEAQESRPQDLPTCPEPEPAIAEAAAASSDAVAPVVEAHGPETHEDTRHEPSSPEAAEEYRPDTETVRSTAEAWASWRQIRDTRKDGEAAQAQSKEFEVSEPAPAETAAMAVAAGAEQIAQEASTALKGESGDVASIVESVLANLRPKLMEEISRKMAEKK